ncbi:hypothetical protein MMC29_000449 [Sticta canariensis]|nr:hypothetical protein [Sticta canariensis]
MLGLPKARELVIERNDTFPAWTVHELIEKLCKLCADTERQYLVIAHYAGHAAINDFSGKLAFHPSAEEPQMMLMNRTFDLLCDEDDPESFKSTDVLIILDCCYGGMAIWGIDGQKRSVEIVEIIASVGHDQKAVGNPSDLARIVNQTFTFRLVDEVAKSVGRADVTSISFAELVDELRRTSKLIDYLSIGWALAG